MAITARFYIASYEKKAGTYHSVTMYAVTRGKENEVWSYFSPSGNLQMNVRAGSPAAAWFEANVGRDVALDFTLRDDAELAPIPHYVQSGESAGSVDHYTDKFGEPIED